MLLPITIFFHSCETPGKHDQAHPAEEAFEELFTKIGEAYGIDDDPTCSAAEMVILSASEEGEFEVVREFLRLGGDPDFECEEWRRRYDQSLFDQVTYTDSTEFLKYYFTHDLPQERLNEALLHFVRDGNGELTRVLVEKGAQYWPESESYSSVCDDTITHFQLLIENNYDLNHADPTRNGKTLLISLASCSCDSEYQNSAEETITIMQYLVNNGARTDIETNTGQPITDFGRHPDIIAFLKTLKLH